MSFNITIKKELENNSLKELNIISKIQFLNTETAKDTTGKKIFRKSIPLIRGM